MTDQTANAVLAVYPNRVYAEAAVTYLQRMQQSNQANFDGLAIVTRSIDGEVAAEEIGATTVKRGARRGAAIGAAIGLIFPPSVIGAAAIGAGLGGIAGRIGGNNEHAQALREMGEQLERGFAGIIVIVDDAHVDDVINTLTGYTALHRQRVDSATLSAVQSDEDRSNPV